jgi:hypothetical protein
MSKVKLDILSLKHKMATRWKIKANQTPRVAIMKVENNGPYQVDVATRNITPFTSNLKDEDLHGNMPHATKCGYANWHDFTNVNDRGRHIWCLTSPPLRVKSFISSMLFLNMWIRMCTNSWSIWAIIHTFDPHFFCTSGSKKETWCFAIMCTLWGTLMEPTNHAPQKSQKKI